MAPKKRMLILGLDGLEYDLVEKFDLKNLKQNEYGKTDISHYPVANTPLLWGSFLTGRNVSKDYWLSLKYDAAIRFLFESSERLMPFLYNKMRKIYQRYSTNERLKAILSPGITKTWNFNAKKESTIFDLFENPKSIEFVTYDIQHAFENIMPIRMYFVTEELNDNNFEEFIWRVRFDRIINKLCTALENDSYDLIATYLNELDPIGHIFRGDLTVMERNYRKFDELVGEVKKKFDGRILIISDHGMNPLGRYGDHLHIDHGFYSCNHDLNLNNPKPEDFYNIIQKWRN